MKIGIVAYSNPKGGGTYQYSEMFIQSVLAAAENDKSLEIFVITKKDDKRFENIQKLNIIYYDFKINVFIRLFIFFSPRFFGNKFREFFAPSIIKKLNHVHSCSITLNPILYFADKASFTFHDLQYKDYPENFSFLDRFKRDLTAKRLLRHVQFCICETSFVKKSIFRHYRFDKSYIIPGYVKRVFYDTNRTKLKKDKFVFFYPAQFWVHKNHERLLQAFIKLQKIEPDTELVLTGGYNLQYPLLKRYLQNLGIIHKPGLQENEIIQEYKRADCVIVPSIYESRSIPVDEATCLGLPVLLSEIDLLSDQIDDRYPNFNPYSANDMTASMLDMMKNYEKYEQVALLKKNTWKDNSLMNLSGKKFINAIG